MMNFFNTLRSFVADTLAVVEKVFTAKQCACGVEIDPKYTVCFDCHMKRMAAKNAQEPPVEERPAVRHCACGAVLTGRWKSCADCRKAAKIAPEEVPLVVDEHPRYTAGSLPDGWVRRNNECDAAAVGELTSPLRHCACGAALTGSWRRCYTCNVAAKKERQATEEAAEVKIATRHCACGAVLTSTYKQCYKCHTAAKTAEEKPAARLCACGGELTGRAKSCAACKAAKAEKKAKGEKPEKKAKKTVASPGEKLCACGAALTGKWRRCQACVRAVALAPAAPAPEVADRPTVIISVTEFADLVAGGDEQMAARFAKVVARQKKIFYRAQAVLGGTVNVAAPKKVTADMPFAVQQGIYNEARVRREYEALLGVKLQTEFTRAHRYFEYPTCRLLVVGEPDGISADGLFECKWRMGAAALDRIATRDYIQMSLCMMLYGKSYTDFVQSTAGDITFYRLTYRSEAWLDKLLRSVTEQVVAGGEFELPFALSAEWGGDNVKLLA